MLDTTVIKRRLDRLDAAVEAAASTGMMRITPELMGARQAFQVNAVNDVRLLLAEVESMRMKEVAEALRIQQVLVSREEGLLGLPDGAVILDAEKKILRKGERFWNTIGMGRAFLSAEVPLPARVIYQPTEEG